ERFHEFVAHFLPDANRAIALHVAVPTHGAHAGPFTADVSTKQREVENALDVGDAVLVLSDAHRPGADHSFGLDRDLGGLVNQFAGNAAAFHNPIPALVSDVLGKGFESFGLLVDEIMRQ